MDYGVLIAVYENEDRVERDNIVLRMRRRIRDAADPFALPENEFRSLYRISREAAHALIEELRPFLPVTRRRTAISVEIKVLTTLNFFASGSYQKRVGQDYLSCVSQPMVSIVLHEVVDALNELMENWIKFPVNPADLQRIKERFWQRTQFPGVIGAVDGTHIAIVPPTADREHLYINRKLYHSLNVMIVCDFDGKILAVNACHGGRTHDARVWRTSAVSNHLHEQYMNGRSDTWLLADSAYPLLPYVMTPKLNALEGTPSARYTQRHVCARSAVERCIGVLKGRWRCLRRGRALHYKPEFAAKIINAVCVLHNIAVHWRLVQEAVYHDPIVEDIHDRLDIENGALVENGGEVRERIIRSYFTN